MRGLADTSELMFPCVLTPQLEQGSGGWLMRRVTIKSLDGDT
jgi:hypothetical protein